MNDKANITLIDSRMDRLDIKTANGDIHSIPVSVFRHVVSGKLTVNRIADFIPIYREITAEWLRLKGY